jgi:hypothetical protein
MIGVGSSLAQITLSSFTTLNGFISQSEKFRKLHENPNHIPRFRNILILVDPLPLGGSIMFLKLECNGELKEGNTIIRVEFSRFVACVLI